MTRRQGTALWKPGHPYSATHGQIVLHAKTYRAALKLAVAEARRFDTVVHVVHRAKNPTVIATCMPKTSRSKVITCDLRPGYIKKRKPRR